MNPQNGSGEFWAIVTAVISFFGVLIYVVVYWERLRHFGKNLWSVMNRPLGSGRFFLKRREAPVPLKELILKRQATMKSLECEPTHIDHIHHYSLIHRIDQLDYATKDFFSVRRLKGINTTSTPSHSFVYCECSENKLKFSEIGIRAVDLKTKMELRVEPLNNPEDYSFQHPFRICFRQQIKPKSEFDVAYHIRLPGELHVVPDKNEIMSVSLRRVAHGPQKLVFDVCLNFKASQSLYAYMTEANEIFIPERATIKETIYQPKLTWEKDLGLQQWSSQPWKISLTVNTPQKAVYIINYKR
jgi:hypothetical protein